MGNEHGRLGEPTPAGIQSMDESLQRKFAKGIQYNMKIVIRGDRNTGKSCLFHRMEGKAFQEAYIPTNEIQVTSILWSYRVTNDTVKVEIWDVVDKGRTQKKGGRGGGSLKMFNDPDEQEEGDKVLDAGFLDVYKGAHGVVFLYDVTKQWTWQYIERELPKVPFSIPVMILGNFRDIGDHRVVSKEVCSYYIEHMDRPEGAADVRYAESSMKNGFGLMHLHKFLSIPFLQLQQETLLQQLQVNREQMLAARDELNAAHHTEDQSYDLFERKLERMAEEKVRRRTKSMEQEPGEGDESPTTPRRRDLTEAETKPSGGDSPDSPHDHRPQTQQAPSSFVNAEGNHKGSFKSKLTSKLSGFLSRVKEEAGREDRPTALPKTPPTRPKVKPTSKVEDFVPEGDVDGFFEDDEDEEDEEEDDDEEDSDDEINTGKPQIAMDEDLSSPEVDEEEEKEAPPTAPPTSKTPPQAKRPAVVLKSAKDVELTESEEEEDTPAIMADEDIEEKESKPEPVANKKTKDVLSGELFDIAPPPERKKKAGKSSGLMLEFSLPPAPAQTKKLSKEKESPMGTPDTSEKRRESKGKKKKSKKSRHSKEEEEEPTKIERGSRGGAVTQAPPIASDDPFGPISALDAWLNSDATDSMDGVLQPSKTEPKKEPKAVSIDFGEEEGEGGESPETHHKKTKKHKHHKKHHQGEREGDEEGRLGSRRKHRHHKSSRHGGSSTSSRPSEEQAGEYDQI